MVFGAGSKAKAMPASEAWAITASNHATRSMLLSKQNQSLSLNKGNPGSYRPPYGLAGRAVLAPYTSHQFHEGSLEQAMWPPLASFLSLQYRHFQMVRKTD